MGGFKIIEDEELQKIIRDEKFIFLVGMIFPPRPGVMPFLTQLEHNYFPPGTKKNNEFIMVISAWKDVNWVIAGIPKEYMEKAKRIADSFRLKIIDGIPYMVIEGELISFPINGKNVFTLENVYSYDNNPQEYKKIMEEEKTKIASIINNATKNQEKPKNIKIDWDN